MTACATATARAPEAGVPPIALERPLPYPAFESPEFDRAVARGTRSRSGEPGPSYWQQFAEYSLAAELNPATAVLTGSGRVRYHNRSPDTLYRVVVHLYQNLHAPDAERNERVPVTGGMQLTRVTADGQEISSGGAGSASYAITGTVATISLAEPLASDSSVALEFDWWFRVPPTGTPRMGQDGEVFHLGYWYPQVAVYDDVVGWDTELYRGNGEFYMGYADYEVAITVPGGWIVSATGDLTNASEVLTPAVRERLARARATGEIVTVVSAGERSAGVATAAGERLTWRFSARNVRDFSWNASNRYVWDATRALVPQAAAAVGQDTVMIHALYRPDAPQREHWAELGRHSIEFPSRVLWPYPYPHMTYVEGLISGGMEYPMITLIGRLASPTVLALHSVTIHETVHMWYPMLVGSNERHFAWMDEGLSRFVQLDGMQDRFPDIPRDSLRRDTYVPLARARAEVESMRHADLFPPGSSFGVASYDKPAKALHALRAVVGEETFWRAMREYGRRWTNRHPQPWDLFNTFESVSGRPLDWFWRTWLYETWVLDQAIGAVTPSGNDLLVTIEDRGLAPMPVRLAVTRGDGRVEMLEIPVDVWLSGRRRHVERVPDAAAARAIEIDPEGFFPDVDRSNNRWER